MNRVTLMLPLLPIRITAVILTVHYFNRFSPLSRAGASDRLHVFLLTSAALLLYSFHHRWPISRIGGNRPVCFGSVPLWMGFCRSLSSGLKKAA